MLIDALKKMGVKRATITEYVHQLGSELVIGCRPMPSDEALKEFKSKLPPGVLLETYELNWWENLFKRFKVQEYYGPRPPRHHNCRCTVERN